MPAMLPLIGLVRMLERWRVAAAGRVALAVDAGQMRGEGVADRSPRVSLVRMRRSRLRLGMLLLNTCGYISSC